MKISITAGVTALLTVATAAHAAYRYAAWPEGPAVVSTFQVGQDAPKLAQSPLRAEVDTASESRKCHILVVFSPFCPHCRTAAQREKASGSARRLPVVWLTPTADSADVAFGTRLREESLLRHAPDVKDALQVEAVPAAFLVGRDGRVRDIWVYQGTEEHAELEGRCT